MNFISEDVLLFPLSANQTVSGVSTIPTIVISPTQSSASPNPTFAFVSSTSPSNSTTPKVNPPSPSTVPTESLNMFGSRVPRSSYVLMKQKLPDFSKAASWDSISESYNSLKSQPTLEKKRRRKSKTFPYLMSLGLGIKYAEWFELQKPSHTVIMHRNEAFEKGTARCLVFSIEHREFDSVFTVAPMTNEMPSRDSVALLPSNRSFSTDVWYDRVAILSTRGFTNIYHNAEWIANFYHIALNIEKFPLVLPNSRYELVLRVYHRKPDVRRRRRAIRMDAFVFNGDVKHVSERDSSVLCSVFLVLL